MIQSTMALPAVPTTTIKVKLNVQMMLAALMDVCAHTERTFELDKGG